MKTKLLFWMVFCTSILVRAQHQSVWETSTSVSSTEKTALKNKYYDGIYILNQEKLQAYLQTTPETMEQSITVVDFPNTKGTMEQFLIWKTPTFDPILQAQYPSIQSFSGKGISDPQATVYFSISPKGIQTMILRNDATTEFMEPIGTSQKYAFYRSDKRTKGKTPFVCTTEEAVITTNLNAKIAKNKASDRLFRTLKLALSCTGEYAAYHGGTVEGALAAMNTTITRVNGIFNRDLALKLMIIANNDAVIYTNSITDPYATVIDGEAPEAWSQELENTLTTVIGTANYDIGHLFGASGGGGNAGCIGCVCEADKGRAYTSPSNDKPEGDTFDIDFVAHEFGHQLGANHTFSHEIEDTNVNVEPGSGSTIMGYAGLTDFDVQKNSDAYFAFASINQIQQNLAYKTCGTTAIIDNNLMTVAAGTTVTIPKGTPFFLKGSSSGNDTSTYTYTWEQNDSATTASGAQSVALSTKTDGPIFRSFPPTTSLTRYFPAYEKVLSGQLSSMWESVSDIARNLTFVFTARDNAALGLGQTATDDVAVTVAAAGPFEITSQNTPDVNWIQGTNQLITWNVNATHSLPGAATVTIRLSTDGGLTFPIILAAETPNDGTQYINVPNVTSLNCRILIEPTNNVFYAVNSTEFAIGYTTVSSFNTYVFATPIPIPDGTTSYTTREITVPQDKGTITAVTLNIGLSHTYLSDVELEIQSPQNTTLRLLQRVCGGTDNTFSLTFDDKGKVIDCADETPQTITPTDLLSTLKNQDPTGIWTLKVRDAFDNDSGIINSASVTIYTQKATLIADKKEISNLQLYPNPSNGKFKIEFSSSSNSEIRISVADLLGRKIFQKQYEKTSDFNETIDLNTIPPGIYLLTIIEGSKKVVKKIMIE